MEMPRVVKFSSVVALKGGIQFNRVLWCANTDLSHRRNCVW